MRAPLAFVAAAFAIGIGLDWWIRPSLLLMGGFLFAAAFGLLRMRGRPAAANLAILALITILGILRAEADARVPAAALSRALTETPQPVTCEGVVVSDVEWVRPLHGRAHLQGWLRVTGIQQAEGWVPASGRLLVRLPPELAEGSGRQRPTYGDRVRFAGEVRGPRRSKPDAGTGHRFERWLWLRHACGRMTVADPMGVSRLETAPTPLVLARRSLADFRRRLEQLGRSLLGPVEVAYLEGLLLAERQGIPPSIYEAFRRTGTVHVLVVSGLQVSLIGSMVFIGLSLLRAPRVLRHLGTAGAMVLYCVLTGYDPPILRATLMGLLFCGGKIAGRETSSLNGLGLAALLILGEDPRALADASFQLSFAAMGGLLGFSPWIEKQLQAVSQMSSSRKRGSDSPFRGNDTGSALRRHLVKTVAASCGAWTWVLPIVALHFHLVTPIALAGNLLVIPWSSALIAVGFLLYALALFNLPLMLPVAASFAWMARGLTWTVNWMAALPGAFWEW